MASGTRWSFSAHNAALAAPSLSLSSTTPAALTWVIVSDILYQKSVAAQFVLRGVELHSRNCSAQTTIHYILPVRVVRKRG